MAFKNRQHHTSSISLAFTARQLQVFLLATLIVFAATIELARATNNDGHVTFRRVPTQFIAALGDPNASSGKGAETWGLWEKDPGPRGVWLRNFAQLEDSGGIAPLNWKFDDNDWWLDENGLLMEKPDFPVPPGRYLVTGERETVTVLTVHPENYAGERYWELANGAVLFDVTHLPCRSARYTPLDEVNRCTPADAHITHFPVTPGAEMPVVKGCAKQDYSVLFIIGVEVKS
ncbi:MAG: hypothetical protein AAF353_07530 [Pseudomonadota bacterium]